jgi:hypothetical protein
LAAVCEKFAATGGDLTAPGGLTEQASTFDRRDVLRAWAVAHREGADIEHLEQLTDRWLASDRAVRLEDDGGAGLATGPERRAGRDGRSLTTSVQGVEVVRAAAGTGKTAVWPSTSARSSCIRFDDNSDIARPQCSL